MNFKLDLSRESGQIHILGSTQAMNEMLFLLLVEWSFSVLQPHIYIHPVKRMWPLVGQTSQCGDQIFMTYKFGQAHSQDSQNSAAMEP